MGEKKRFCVVIAVLLFVNSPNGAKVSITHVSVAQPGVLMLTKALISSLGEAEVHAMHAKMFLDEHKKDLQKLK